MASNSDEIGKSLKSVIGRLQKATESRPKSLPQITPRLVAVTKTKPVSDILTAYKHGQRHFGENYVMELEEKSKEPVILEQCADIKWHFIGHLQRNKANKVTVLPNLYMVETVDSQKLAQTLNNNWEKFKRPGKLKVMIQINTSGEDSKSGCDKETMVQLATFVREKCPCLEFAGIMTIGAYGYNIEDGPNPDFLSLVKCREDLCKALNLSLGDVELSMGMSTDFEHAIELGSTNVRVGSTIFGARNVPQKSVPGTSGSQPQSDSSQSQPSESSQSDANSQSENRCSQLPSSSQSESRDNGISQSQPSESSQSDVNSQSETRCSQLQSESRDNGISQPQDFVVNGPIETVEEINCDTNSGEVSNSFENLNLS
ncbi:pyridoxal phosphate homeostasis protein-like [Mercenaria mercenaria]|uniref:pyridoxal phosphate homeostasis protein-like n=1 Tax=Mercenaria mercenaria TaxID=6596 RepID=UPI00234F5D49|nr:pyridoxal phosphate homeostasis protein-like [Mercenaria mercenaria]